MASVLVCRCWKQVDRHLATYSFSPLSPLLSFGPGASGEVQAMAPAVDSGLPALGEIGGFGELFLHSISKELIEATMSCCP